MPCALLSCVACKQWRRQAHKNSPEPMLHGLSFRRMVRAHTEAARGERASAWMGKEKGQRLAGPDSFPVTQVAGAAMAYAPSAANCVPTYYRREGELLYSRPYAATSRSCSSNFSRTV